MEKGILSKQTTKIIVGLVIPLLPLKGWMKFIAGSVLKFLVGFLDDKFGERIPEPHRMDLRMLLDRVFIDGQYGDAIDRAMAKLDQIVDLPFLGDPAEKEFFNMIATALKALLLKKKGL